jgi:hypothetical protein
MAVGGAKQIGSWWAIRFLIRMMLFIFLKTFVWFTPKGMPGKIFNNVLPTMNCEEKRPDTQLKRIICCDPARAFGERMLQR